MLLNYFSKKNIDEQVELQNQHVNQMKSGTKSKTFLGGEQFFQSMRMDGYSNEGEAICDIIDNSIEAGAENVNIVLRREGSNDLKKIDAIAIVDDGHGMNQDMLESSIGFGSTSRGEKRDGLGRFGMGLSKAGIAFSEFLEVFSRSNPSSSLQSVGRFKKTFIDLRKKSETYFNDDYFSNVLKGSPPKAKDEDLPNWVEDALGYEKTRKARTVVVLSNFTNSKRKWGPKQFVSMLKHHVGVIYHKFNGNIKIHINDFSLSKSEELEFIDPLFITNGLKGFDLDSDRAIELPGESLNLVDEEKNAEGKVIKTINLGELSVRLSIMPPSFALKEGMKESASQVSNLNSNSRWKTMRDYFGVILVRNGRVIGVDSRKPTRFLNNDTNIGVELSFSGKADDLMGITNKKNSVSLSDDGWDFIDKKVGIKRGISSCRSELKKLKNTAPKPTIKTKDGNLLLPSEVVASHEAQNPRKELSEEVKNILKTEGEKNINNEVQKIVRETSEDKEDVTDKLVRDILAKKFKVETQNLHGADFVTFAQLGMQTRVIINKDHLFYKELYASEHVGPKAKECLSLLLMSLFRSILLTNIDNNSAGKPLCESKVYRDLMKNWSEVFSEQLIELNKLLPDNDPLPTPGNSETENQ